MSLVQVSFIPYSQGSRQSLTGKKVVLEILDVVLR